MLFPSKEPLFRAAIADSSTGPLYVLPSCRGEVC